MVFCSLCVSPEQQSLMITLAINPLSPLIEAFRQGFSGSFNASESPSEVYFPIQTSRIPFTEQRQQMLSVMRNRLNEYRLNASRYLLRYGDELGALGDATIPHDPDEMIPGRVRSFMQSRPDPLEGDFLTLMNDCQQMILSWFQDCPGILKTLALLSNDNMAKYTQEPMAFPTFTSRINPANIDLVLLVDEWMEDLPLEGLDPFKGFPSISRDYSLHLLSHRLMAVAKSHPSSSAAAPAGLSASSGTTSWVELPNPGVPLTPPDLLVEPNFSITHNPVQNLKSTNVSAIVDSRNEDRGSTVNEFPRQPVSTFFDAVCTCI